jgi:hypothetical protein
MPGVAYVRYLTPIQPNEVKDKEEMSRLVRRRMLTSMLNDPPDVGRNITWGERFIQLIWMSIALVINISFATVTFQQISKHFQLNSIMTLLFILFIIIMYTLITYIHYVYVKQWLLMYSQKHKDSKKIK